MMETPPPVGMVTLAEAIDQLGRAMFDGKWTSEEPRQPVPARLQAREVSKCPPPIQPIDTWSTSDDAWDEAKAAPARVTRKTSPTVRRVAQLPTELQQWLADQRKTDAEREAERQAWHDGYERFCAVAKHMRECLEGDQLGGYVRNAATYAPELIDRYRWGGPDWFSIFQTGKIKTTTTSGIYDPVARDIMRPVFIEADGLSDAIERERQKWSPTTKGWEEEAERTLRSLAQNFKLKMGEAPVKAELARMYDRGRLGPGAINRVWGKVAADYPEIRGLKGKRKAPRVTTVTKTGRQTVAKSKANRNSSSEKA